MNWKNEEETENKSLFVKRTSGASQTSKKYHTVPKDLRKSKLSKDQNVHKPKREEKGEKGHGIIEHFSYRNNHLKSLVRSGIPNHLRSKLWHFWSGAKFKLDLWPGHYEDILKYYEGQPSSATEDIEKVKIG